MFGLWHKGFDDWVRLKLILEPVWECLGDSILCYETEEMAERARDFCFPRLKSMVVVRNLCDT